MTNVPTTAKILTLQDGRVLGYAEFGDPDGLPIIGFHGMPGSRLMMQTLEQAALINGVRLIAPDRPGYGLSQAKTHATLLGYVDDIVQLTDALQIERLAVLGVSGGGPYPLACAYKIPRRITIAALISGIGPLRLPHSTRDMLRPNKIMFTVGRWSPRLTGFLLPRLIRSS